MNLLTVLLAILGAAAVFFVVSFAVDLVKHKDELKKEQEKMIIALLRKEG